ARLLAQALQRRIGGGDEVLDPVEAGGIGGEQRASAVEAVAVALDQPVALEGRQQPCSRRTGQFGRFDHFGVGNRVVGPDDQRQYLGCPVYRLGPIAHRAQLRRGKYGRRPHGPPTALTLPHTLAPLVGLCHVRYSFEMSNSEPVSEAPHPTSGAVHPASGAVQSVDRAVTILEIIARTGQAGITEIAGELEEHKSTASRIVSTLEARGLVEQDQHRRKYRLGLSILRLAGATTARLDIVQEARPIAKLLAEETGETINVAVLSDGAALCLDQAASTASVQSHNWVGQRIPLHATSNGKVLLSGLSEDSIRSTLAAKLPRFTPHTVTSIPQLLTQVAEVAATGSSLVIDELEVGLTAVSAPVRNAHGDVIASISASGPSFRFTEVKARSARDLLMSAAADISARLGWREH